MYGKSFVQIDRFFSSSKLCSNCGYKNEGLTLDIRHWTCPECEMDHDCDINGALNHEADLSRLQFGIWHMKLNQKGFFWTSEGIFDSYGSEITVPDIKR